MNTMQVARARMHLFSRGRFCARIESGPYAGHEYVIDPPLYRMIGEALTVRFLPGNLHATIVSWEEGGEPDLA